MINKLLTIKLMGWIAATGFCVATGGIPSPGLLLGLAIIALNYGDQTPRKRRLKGWIRALKFWMLM